MYQQLKKCIYFFFERPYVPLVATMHGNETRLSDKTICMTTEQGENNEYKHYDVHNIYGLTQSLPTLE